MRVVIDTNVVISGAFFGGIPRKIMEMAIDERFSVCANDNIVQEYKETTQEMIADKKGHINENVLSSFLRELELLSPQSSLSVCRDPDDDKFINCAIDAKAIYVVSGDKDLLSMGQVEGILMITAREFYDKLMDENALARMESDMSANDPNAKTYSNFEEFMTEMKQENE